MLPRITTTRSEPASPAPAAIPNFAELRPRSPKRVFSFLSSLGLHVAVVWFLSSTVNAVTARQASIHKDLSFRALQMTTASVVWPGRLTDPAGSGKSAPVHPAGRPSSEPAASGAQAPTPPASTPEDSGSAGEKTPAPPRQEKRFQLPAVTVKKPVPQVLVRIDVPPELKLNPKIVIPKILLWQLPAPVKPKNQIVEAAHREEPPVRQRETPPVTPKLVARNNEEALAELRHAAAPPVPVPVIPLPVANTTPIRMLDGVLGNRLPNITGPVVKAPEEVHVISVPEFSVPTAGVIPLPPGSQGTLPPLPPGANAGGGGRGTSGSGTQPGALSDNQRRGVNSGADGTSKSSQSSSQPGSAGVDAGNGNGRSNALEARAGNGGPTADPGETGRGGGSAAGGTGGIAPAPPNTTLIVRPRTGKYSVVVMGSANLEAYPDAAGILSGKLIYTVYIRAGWRKEWILQYCLPKAVEQAVKLRGSAVPIEAPYPFVIYSPDLKLLNDPDYLIVHGFINSLGRFEHLSTVGEIDSASRELLMSALENWEFRPASRDGEPRAVEFALIIPREPI